MRLAQINVSPPPNTQPGLFNHETFLGTLFSRIFQFAILAAGMFFLVRLIITGYRYLTSTGDPGKVQAATNEITYGFVGLLIVISVYFLAKTIEAIFNIKIVS